MLALMRAHGKASQASSWAAGIRNCKTKGLAMALGDTATCNLAVIRHHSIGPWEDELARDSLTQLPVYMPLSWVRAHLSLERIQRIVSAGTRRRTGLPEVVAVVVPTPAPTAAAAAHIWAAPPPAPALVCLF